MKTTTFFRTLLLALLMAARSISAMAQKTNYEPYDFREVNADGDTLYYRITSDSEPYTVAVTRCHDSIYHTLPFPFYEWEIGHPGFVYPVYDYDSLINIPPTVTHEGITYTVTAIDNEAFYYQRGMSIVNLPPTIVTIDSGAFYLSSLTEITLQEGLQRINYLAFHHTQIREICFPRSLSYIGQYAFEGTYLSNLSIPPMVDTLRWGTFQGCPIEHITFHEGLVVIEDKAFSGEYIDSLIFPSTLQYMGSIQKYPGSYQNLVENRCKYIEFRNGQEPLFLGDHCLEGCTHLEKLVFSDNIVSFGIGCFSYSNVDTMLIPQNISKIPMYCFSPCDSLRKIVLPSFLDTIEACAFSGCPLLKTIVFPQELKYIGTSAFFNYGDSMGIEELCALSETPPILWGMPNTVFPKTWPIICTIPCGTLLAYQNSRWGTEYSNITFVEDCEAVADYFIGNIKIYPNPADNIIHIEGLANEKNLIYVYDMFGKMVAFVNACNNVTDINIAHLPEGYYILKITGINENYGVKICKK